jgi:hypothetical protein
MLTVHITPATTPAGKLADVELHFTLDPEQSTESARSFAVLDGLKLIGFAIWERRGGSGRNVTFPARQYSVNGERRTFALLRPARDPMSIDRMRDFILRAYADYEAAQAAPATPVAPPALPLVEPPVRTPWHNDVSLTRGRRKGA